MLLWDGRVQNSPSVNFSFRPNGRTEAGPVGLLCLSDRRARNMLKMFGRGGGGGTVGWRQAILSWSQRPTASLSLVYNWPHTPLVVI